MVQKGLSVRQTEALVRRLQQTGEKSKQPAPRSRDPDIVRLQDELSQRLAAKVELKHLSSGKGQLLIQYNSLDELDGILERIR